MSGPNRITPASEFHRHSSWGRTRRPKNLNGATSTAQIAQPTDDAPTAATDGYSTENQRFLHVLLDTDQDNSNCKITIWAYSHAFGAWGALSDISGNEVAISANNTTKHQVFEISGVDRVYFQNTAPGGGDDFGGNDRLFAACSTF